MTTVRTLLWLGAAGAGGCAEGAYDMAQASADSGWVAGDGPGADYGADTGVGDAADDGLGSEEESSFFELRPAATPAYVFVANPDRDTVTRITAGTLDVVTTPVGVRPTVALTTADYSKAVTFNMGSDSVSIIDADTLDVTEVPVRDGFNQMVMSPDGRWVACFHDPAGEDPGTQGGTQSYNELSLVDIETYEHVPLVVGTSPHDVVFTDDSTKAVVVSDDYLTIIDLTVDPPTPEHVQIADDLIDPVPAEEVVLDPAGTWAIVRQYAATVLRAVNLEDLTVDDLDVGDNPTDIDVTPDGGHAVAVARGSGELWVYDLSDVHAPPDIVELPAGEVFGSIVMSPDNTKGLLYSTASGDARYGSWNRETGEVTVRSLVKPVSAIGVSPTGGTALVFHPKENGDDVDPDSPYYNHYALTLVDLDTFFSNPLKLPAEPTGYANTGDGESGVFIMDGEPTLVALDYSSLLYDEVELKSNPVDVGVLPETRVAWASQEHTLGRMSFYDIDSGELRTITGFELNSEIEEY